MGRASARRSNALRVPHSRRRSSGPVLAHDPEETRGLSEGLSGFRSHDRGLVRSAGGPAAARRPRDRAKSAQDRLRDSERAVDPGHSEGVRQLRCLPLEVRAGPTPDQPMEKPEANSCKHGRIGCIERGAEDPGIDRKSTRLNSSHQIISYAVFCLKKKNEKSKTV